MKKILAMLLAAVMIVGMSTGWHSSDEQPQTAGQDETVVTGAEEATLKITTNGVAEQTTEWTAEATAAPMEAAEHLQTEESKPVDPAPLHTYEKTTVKGTDSEDASTLSTDSCEPSNHGDDVSAMEHDFGAWIVVREPSIFSNGVEERQCKHCDLKERLDIPKNSIFHTHEYTDKVTSEPLCQKEGVRTFTCSCGASYTEPIAKTSHKYTSAKVAPTCSVNGYTLHQCTTCGAAYKTDEVAATGHDYVKVSDTATCTSGGTVTEKCTKCGQTHTSSSPALGHNLTTETKDATCGAAGYTREVCTVCGTIVSETTIEPTGEHQWTTKNLAEHAHDMVNRGEDYWYWSTYYSAFATNATVCPVCGDWDESSGQHIHQGTAGSYEMLDMVNNLRESVYGTSDYNLTIDPTLNELAAIRAKEYSISHSHYGGTYTNAAENAADSYTLADHFNLWYRSPLHKQNMLMKDYKYFGFGLQTVTVNRSSAIQLFWSEKMRDSYYM